MDVSATTSQINSALLQSSAPPVEKKSLNAFGIGQANQPEVQLSAQGKILQQVEQSQQKNSLNQEQKKTDSSDDKEQIKDNYVRVSSSVGSAQKNNLTGEQATEVYRSIEKLL